MGQSYSSYCDGTFSQQQRDFVCVKVTRRHVYKLQDNKRHRRPRLVLVLVLARVHDRRRHHIRASALGVAGGGWLVGGS